MRECDTVGMIRVVLERGWSLLDRLVEVGLPNRSQHDARWVDLELEGDVSVLLVGEDAHDRVDPAVGRKDGVLVEQVVPIPFAGRAGLGGVCLVVGVVHGHAERIGEG